MEEREREKRVERHRREKKRETEKIERREQLEEEIARRKSKSESARVRNGREQARGREREKMRPHLAKRQKRQKKSEFCWRKKVASRDYRCNSECWGCYKLNHQ